MPDATNNFAIPFAEGIDDADVPVTTQAMADRLDELLTQVLEATSFLSAVPSARVRRQTNQSIANNVTPIWPAISFDVQEFDTDGMFDLVGEPTRLTVQHEGIYIASGFLVFAGNATGIRAAGIRKNGDALGSLAEASARGDLGPGGGAGGNALNVVSPPTWLQAGDYIELIAYQNSGAALNVMGDIAHATRFGLQWMRPAP